MLPSVLIEGVSFPNYPRIANSEWSGILEDAIRSAKQAHQDIVDNPEPPSFENTFEALQHRGDKLSIASQAFFVPSRAHATPAMIALRKEWAPKLQAMATELLQDPILFQRCKHAFDHRKNWSDEQELLARDELKDFIRAGAGLDEGKRERLLVINVRLSELSADIHSKLDAASRKELMFTADELTGVDTSKMKSKGEGAERAFAVRMLRSNITPIMTQCSVRQTRKKVHETFIKRNHHGVNATEELIAETLTLRQEQARILGYKTYADLVTGDNMAQNPEAVEKLIQESWDHVQPAFKRDIELVREAALEDGIDALKAWDVPFYTEKVRVRDYAIDGERVKSYLSLQCVKEAAFATAGKLFGISFEAIDAPVYHEHCQAWLVRTTSNGEVIGGFITDYRTRETKGAGAWMTSINIGHRMGAGRKPLVVNVCSFGDQDDMDQVLLDMLDASTLFHELGHALHGLLSHATYPAQAGTGVVRDWVEVPSQLLENWMTSERGLLAHAKNSATQEPMTHELAQKIIQARQFGQAFDKIHYLQSARLDMAIHALDNGAPESLEQFSREVLDSLGADALLPPWHKLPHFAHIFAGGYAAGYYGYLWAEVMEADIFNLFEHDLFDEEAAKKIHQFLYAPGGSREAKDLFMDLVGRKPSPKALMARLGAQKKRRAPTT